MKLFNVLIILFFLTNCSFDNKSGIWKNEDLNSNTKIKQFDEFKSISSTQKKFNKLVILNNNYKFEKNNIITNFEWEDIYYSKNNNLKNFKYDHENQLLFKSKKLTKNKINGNILFKKNNLITNDIKGNLIVFSINQNKIKSKYNFYKKKFKKIKKILNIVVEDDIIYVSDNLGFIYSFNYEKNKILWAKNYKIPFRSNIKVTKDKLILANEKNTLFFINKKNGETLKIIPTEESSVKNRFTNNLAIFKNNLFYLNTYGSIYSLSIQSMKINWFVNVNQSSDINPSNLFTSNKLIIEKNKIFFPANNNFYILDANSGITIFKKSFSSQLNPIVTNNILYTLDNDLLIATELKTGNIIFSYNINQKISEFLNIKKKKAQFKKLIFADNKIFIFLKNSYIVKVNANGSIDEITKLPEKINSNPIIIDNSLIFLNRGNRISIIN
tara:strand:+ start:6043 stop:7365 length:1323 start_codon:yes stop_codon:yes gene_type:complete